MGTEEWPPGSPHLPVAPSTNAAGGSLGPAPRDAELAETEGIEIVVEPWFVEPYFPNQ